MLFGSSECNLYATCLIGAAAMKENSGRNEYSYKGIVWFTLWSVEESKMLVTLPVLISIIKPACVF